VYRAFRDGHRRDPTGLAAIEMVTGRRLEALEKEWHAWILAEPAPPDEGY
jgi:hypothetical protein